MKNSWGTNHTFFYSHSVFYFRLQRSNSEELYMRELDRIKNIQENLDLDNEEHINNVQIVNLERELHVII